MAAAGVQPRWIQGDLKVGGRSQRLWKNTHLIGLHGIASMLQMGIQPVKWEQERSDMGESVFPETDPISLFLGMLIYLLLHIGMNTESRGGQQS